MQYFPLHVRDLGGSVGWRFFCYSISIFIIIIIYFLLRGWLFLFLFFYFFSTTPTAYCHLEQVTLPLHAFRCKYLTSITYIDGKHNYQALYMMIVAGPKAPTDPTLFLLFKFTDTFDTPFTTDSSKRRACCRSHEIAQKR
jgi:hypothetical protein